VSFAKSKQNMVKQNDSKELNHLSRIMPLDDYSRNKMETVLLNLLS